MDIMYNKPQFNAKLNMPNFSEYVDTGQTVSTKSVHGVNPMLSSFGLNVANQLAGNALQGLSAFMLGGKQGFTSWRNSITKQGLTGEQQALQQLQNTQYQRTVADMEAAGLNPAAMYGGHASGNGVVSQGSSSQALQGNFDMLQGLNAILSARNLDAENKVLKAQEKATLARARKDNADAVLSEIDHETRGSMNLSVIDKNIAQAKRELESGKLTATQEASVRFQLSVSANTKAFLELEIEARARKEMGEALTAEEYGKYAEQFVQNSLKEQDLNIQQLTEQIKKTIAETAESTSRTELNKFTLWFNKLNAPAQLEMTKAMAGFTWLQQMEKQVDIDTKSLNLSKLKDTYIAEIKRILAESGIKVNEQKMSDTDVKYYEKFKKMALANAGSQIVKDVLGTALDVANIFVPF